MNQNGFSIPSQSTAPPYQNFYPQNMIPNNNNNNNNMQQDASYAENILTLNVGKFANFYMSFSDSLEWRDRIFSGIIEAAGRDYVIIREQNSNTRVLLWTVYLNYVEFNEQINVKEM